LVGGNDARVGYDFATPLFLQCGELQVEVEIASEEGVGKTRNCASRCEASCGHVDVQTAGQHAIIAVAYVDVVIDIAADYLRAIAGTSAGHAETCAQVAGESIRGDDDTAFDQ